MNKKILLVVLLLLLGLAFYLFELHRWLTLENLKQGRALLEQWRNQAPLLTGVIFTLFYILVTGLSLPGAAILSLTAGALFGLFWGSVIVSFSSSIGGTLAFLVARYVLRDSVQRRFGRRLQIINRGIEREGAFYLFALRLVPVFPFFIINILMALTPIKTWTFYWVSQIGMIAATVVYVNAGTQLARVENLSDILSPGLILSFVLLGLFPLLAQRLLIWIKRHRATHG